MLSLLPEIYRWVDFTHHLLRAEAMNQILSLQVSPEIRTTRKEDDKFRYFGTVIESCGFCTRHPSTKIGTSERSSKVSCGFAHVILQLKILVPVRVWGERECERM
jgi:hypothetical protein